MEQRSTVDRNRQLHSQKTSRACVWWESVLFSTCLPSSTALPPSPVKPRTRRTCSHRQGPRTPSTYAAYGNGCGTHNLTKPPMSRGRSSVFSRPHRCWKGASSGSCRPRVADDIGDVSAPTALDASRSSASWCGHGSASESPVQ